MQRLPLFAAVAIALIAAGAVAGAIVMTDGGGGGDSAARAPRATPTAAETPRATSTAAEGGSSGGGDGPVLYPEPLTLVPGHREWPLSSLEARQRGMAAFNSARSKPQFEGVINGIRLWSYQHAATDSSVTKKFCVGAGGIEWRVTDRLTFDYLPPGTAAFVPQGETRCDDGSLASIGQSFVADVPTFTVYYQTRERAFGQDATAEQVEAATIQGLPGVIIKPLTEEGFGRTWVAFATKNGMIVVDADEMPLDEALKIAEGVRCADC